MYGGGLRVLEVLNIRGVRINFPLLVSAIFPSFPACFLQKFTLTPHNRCLCAFFF